MARWGRRAAEATGRSRERAQARRTATGEAVARAFAARTTNASWVVDVQHGWRVVDRQGQIIYSLRSNNVRDAEGRYLCTIQRPSGALALLDSGLDALVVRSYPAPLLVAAMSTPARGLVSADLLPGGRAGQGNDIYCAGQAWAERARPLSPLSYRYADVADGEVDGRLAGANDRVLATDRRRYVRRVTPSSVSALREWSIDVVANPLPDAWLLGILSAAMMLAAVPVTHRKAL